MKILLAPSVRISPAMVVAMLALFVALAGTAVATTSALITGRQIKNGSITGADVKNKSLTARDIRGRLRGPGGLPGPQGPQGPAGPVGAPGVKGDKGDTGPSNGFSVNTTALLLWTGVDQIVATLALPAGKYVLNGHVNANNNAMAQQTVSCRIALGGTTVGLSEFVRLGGAGATDSQVIAISAGGTLASAGAAQLRCTASSVLGGFPARGLTAIQVAALNGT